MEKKILGLFFGI